MAYNSFSNNNAGPTNFALIQFRKSNNFASVASPDLLGQILWSGYDSATTTFKSAAFIYCQVTGAPAGNIPSELQFYTSFGTGTQEAMIIGQHGAVSISNPAADETSLLVSNNQTSPNIDLQSINSTPSLAPYMQFSRSRLGTSAVLAGDRLSNIIIKGFDGTNYLTTSQILSVASGTIAANRIGSNLEFYTHPDSVTVSTQRMLILPTGSVTINTPDSGVALTINGGGETITAGNLLLSAGNVNIPATTSAVGQYQIAGQTALHAYGTNNIFAGASCGNFTGTGTVNTAVGQGSFFAFTTGSQNTLVGHGTGQTITSGNYNVGLGYWSAINTGTGSSNICINNFGAVESNTLRIGSATGAGNQQLNRAFICGIDGVNVGSVAKVLTMASNQLGTATITAGTGILITPTANTITIATTNGISWVEITGTTQNMAVDTGYIANNAALVTLTLPSVALVGDRVRVAGKGAGLWRIAQNALQVIHFGATDSTIGIGGSVTAILRYDCVELLCITANTDWVVLSSVGNLTVV